MMRNTFTMLAASCLVSFSKLFAADVPAVLAPYLKPNVVIKGEAVVVLPPKGLDKYLAKVEEAAVKDPTWFEEFSKKTPNGVLLPFDEKMGLTKEEYDDYVKIWNSRKMESVEPVQMRLTENGGKWSIQASGRGAVLSLLKFDPKDSNFHSPNGTLARIADIDAVESSILGAWKGQEWKITKEDELISMKENFAIGKTKDGKYGMIVYRLQEATVEGKPVYDKSVVVRFPFK